VSDQGAEASPARVLNRGGLRAGWPRRTIRARLALFYFGAFVVSGVILLIATVALWEGGSHHIGCPRPWTGGLSAQALSGARPAPSFTNTGQTFTIYSSPPGLPWSYWRSFQLRSDGWRRSLPSATSYYHGATREIQPQPE